MIKKEVKYGKRTISYALFRKDVRNINLNLKPNLSVEVSAHKNVPLRTINNFVRRKAPWILKNTEYFMRAQSEKKHPREYINGESYKYLGKQYRLKVFKSSEDSINPDKGYIQLHIRNPENKKQKAKLLKIWYRNKALESFNSSLNRVHKIISKYNVEKPEIAILSMRKRWGSCVGDKKKIILNLDLIHAPKFCIDYVVLHELIHFKYKNHDKKFFDLLNVLMPDWKRRKEILDIEVMKSL